MTKGKGNSRRVIPLTGTAEVIVKKRPALYKVGTYLGDIQRDKDITQLAPNVYGSKFISFDTGSEMVYSIKDILRIWGVSKYHDKMVDTLGKFVDFTDNSMIVLSVDTPRAVEGYSVKDYPDMQRLLYYEIRDKDTGDFRGNGGVLFHRGEMSFHS